MRVNKTLSSLLAVGMLLLLGTMVDAQRASREALTKSPSASSADLKSPIFTSKPERESSGVTDKKAIIGSWLETVTFPEPQPPIKSLSTFSADGSLIVGDQGAVTGETAFTPGHGAWVHEYGRTFSWTSVEIIYSHADGSLIGYLKVSGRYTVDGTGNAYTGNFHADILDPDGNVLFSVEGTNAGTRIPVELLP